MLGRIQLERQGKVYLILHEFTLGYSMNIVVERRRHDQTDHFRRRAEKWGCLLSTTGRAGFGESLAGQVISLFLLIAEGTGRGPNRQAWPKLAPAAR